MTTEEFIFNIIGLTGACLIFFGFYRTSIGKWKGKSFWYELDNLVGALCLVIYQFHLRAYISVTLNTIWAIVAFRGVTAFADRYQRKHKKKKTLRKS